MQGAIQPTALAGQARSSNDRLAEGLGFFSIALGLAELLAPKAVCRAAGLEDHETLIRAYGAREVATGLAILTSHDPTPWIWGRVAGDAVDIATVLATTRDDGRQRTNTGLALAVLVGVAAVDIVCARGLTAEKGGPKTAIADYSDRTGFPRGAQAARGAARDFVVPADMRVPDALGGDVFERRGGQGAATALSSLA